VAVVHRRKAEQPLKAGQRLWQRKISGQWQNRGSGNRKQKTVCSESLNKAGKVQHVCSVGDKDAVCPGRGGR